MFKRRDFFKLFLAFIATIPFINTNPKKKITKDTKIEILDGWILDSKDI